MNYEFLETHGIWGDNRDVRTLLSGIFQIIPRENIRFYYLKNLYIQRSLEVIAFADHKIIIGNFIDITNYEINIYNACDIIKITLKTSAASYSSVDLNIYFKSGFEISLNSHQDTNDHYNSTFAETLKEIARLINQ